MRAIVNYVTDVYRPGQERLEESLAPYGIDTFFFNEGNLKTPPHPENPYAFKISAFEAALESGFEQILWLDASVICVKDPTPVFDWMDRRGVFMEEAGHWAGDWAPDYVLAYFGVTKKQAMRMPMFAAGYLGIDFMNPIGLEFFDKWCKAMKAGMFKGLWTNHRHDMTCGSIIANQMGLLPQYSPGGQFFAYIGDSFGEPKDSVVFHLRGIV